MMISSTTCKISYAGNGATVTFSVPFYFLAAADLVAVIRSSAGVETTKVITTHYTVTGAGVLAGGTVTMVTAPATGETLVIYRDAALTQGADYVANDAFGAESHETALDRLTMLVQRLDDRADRAMGLKETDTIGSGTFQAGSQKIEALGSGSASTDAVNLGQVQALIAVLSAGNSGGMLALFPRATLEGVEIPATVGALRVSGWAAAGDGGQALYKRVVSQPSHLGRFRSVDRYLPNGTVDASNGGWWEYADTARRGQIGGLALSNNAGDATNDIDTAAGMATDSTHLYSMVLATALTKRLDAAWAVGTNQGGLDTGSIANADYYVYLIQRLDTGVVDVIFSASAVAPTLPTNYERYRYIGAFIRASATIRPFRQNGDTFKYKTSVNSYNNTTGSVPYATLVTAVPAGLRVEAILSGRVTQAASAGTISVIFQDGEGTDQGAYVALTDFASNITYWGPLRFMTDTSRQVQWKHGVTSTSIAGLIVDTHGWVDRRGQDA